MFTYKLTIAYDGTPYSGWQVQLTGVGIQEVIQKKLSLLLKKPVGLTGSGRTDAGVHAEAQTAHFHAEEELDIFRIHHALNALLPPDIRIIQLEKMDDSFHARYSTVGKIYTYHLFINPILNPFKRRYCWHIHQKDFSIDKMKEAAAKLIGTHDFKGFASHSSKGVAAHDSIRTIKRIDFSEGEELILTFEGDGFLYKMVRNLVGTLVDIGRGHLPLEVIDEVLRDLDRKKAGQTAPAHGLKLLKVLY